VQDLAEILAALVRALGSIVVAVINRRRDRDDRLDLRRTDDADDRDR